MVFFMYEQLLLHLVGDYLFQSHWMAENKAKPGWVGLTACLAHVLCYGLAFYLYPGITGHELFLVIATHFLIDRYRLAYYVILLKNLLLQPPSDIGDNRFGVHDFDDLDRTTGFPETTPPFLKVWLFIIVDNTLHLLTNYWILKCTINLTSMLEP